MLTIFNRRELTVTFSMKRQAEIREALTAAGINYSLSTRQDPATARGQATLGTGGRSQRELEYVFYVHKDDVDAAQEALRRI